MNLMIKTAWLIGILGALFILAPAQAQQNMRGVAGYVDFESVEKLFDTTPTLAVTIEGQMLELVAEASRADDPELAELLLKLEAIQLRGFPVTPTSFSWLARRADILADDLQEAGWSVVVHLRDDVRYVDMYVEEAEEGIRGLMLMVLDQMESEAVFVNIVGDIDPGELGRIGSKFNIGPMENLTLPN